MLNPNLMNRLGNVQEAEGGEEGGAQEIRTS